MLSRLTFYLNFDNYLDFDVLLTVHLSIILVINPLNAELNLICHLLALLGAQSILHVIRIRVNQLDAQNIVLQ